MQTIRQLAAKNMEKFEKKIPNKQFLLGKFYRLNKHKCLKPQHKKYPVSKTAKLLQKQASLGKLISQKQQMEQQQAPQKTLPYKSYEPLNIFWVNYMKELLKTQQSEETRQLKFLRADYHGATLTVLDSKTKSYIGIKGIIAKETLRTFEVSVKPSEQCQQEKSVKLLKPFCIFLFQIGDDYSFIVNGNSLVYRPSDRIKHKFKFKKAEQHNQSFLSILSQVRNKQQNDQ